MKKLLSLVVVLFSLASSFALDIRIVRENLRLRENSDTGSSVVASMMEGSPVEVLKVGKEATIDGITSNWVLVKTREGARSKNGAPIEKGTAGWCFAGFLDNTPSDLYGLWIFESNPNNGIYFADGIAYYASGKENSWDYYTNGYYTGYLVHYVNSKTVKVFQIWDGMEFGYSVEVVTCTMNNFTLIDNKTGKVYLKQSNIHAYPKAFSQG